MRKRQNGECYVRNIRHFHVGMSFEDIKVHGFGADFEF